MIINVLEIINFEHHNFVLQDTYSAFYLKNNLIKEV